QAVARLDVGRRGGNNLVADVQALGSEDISLFTILVLDERDVRGAVRVVLERHNGCRHIQLLALEVDDTVLFLVAAADVTDGDAAVAVAAGGLLDLFEKALLGLHLRQALVGQHSHISARGRRRVESLDSHLEFQLLDSLLSGWLPHTRTNSAAPSCHSIGFPPEIRPTQVGHRLTWIPLPAPWRRGLVRCADEGGVSKKVSLGTFFVSKGDSVP